MGLKTGDNDSMEMGETGGQKGKEEDEEAKVNAGTGDHLTSTKKTEKLAKNDNTMRNIMFGGMLVAGAALGYMYYKKNTK